MQRLKEALMTEARRKGICLDGYREMRGDNIESLINFYMANPDWCMERNYPDLDFLKKHFSDCEDMGVFVSKTFHGELLSERQAYAFHNCKGVVRVAMDYAQGVIPMLYLANNCRMRIVCEQRENKGNPIKVPVYLFGENQVEARNSPYAEFRIFKNELI